MFTGIIQEIGRVAKVEPHKGGMLLTIETHKLTERLRPGSSIAVQGVCLTVIRHAKFIIRNSFTVQLIPETVSRTTLGGLSVGDPVNLEPSLRVGDEVGGHLVFGHVDGLGVIVEIQKPKTGGLIYKITIPAALREYCPVKASIAVDGISLTITKVGSRFFEVALTDYTVDHTTLGLKKKKDKVNIEIDMLARYVLSAKKFVSSRA